ncbi:MAG: metal-sensitive transcriptional regulator [Firmicutes bacterium]|nr:metal-sensitive transcriptional regulator [Bacillota bacterium]
MAGRHRDEGPPAPSPEGADPVLDLRRRLKRIEGQVRGVQRMLDAGRPCAEILTQLAALREAVSSAGVALIALELERCLGDETEVDGPVGRRLTEDERARRVREATEMFLKFS